jgi:hypothetical protein
VRIFKLKFLSAAGCAAQRDDYDAQGIYAGSVLFREEKIWGKLELIINQRELLQHKSCGINFFTWWRDFKILHVLFGLGIILFPTNMKCFHCRG